MDNSATHKNQMKNWVEKSLRDGFSKEYLTKYLLERNYEEAYIADLFGSDTILPEQETPSRPSEASDKNNVHSTVPPKKSIRKFGFPLLTVVAIGLLFGAGFYFSDMFTFMSTDLLLLCSLLFNLLLVLWLGYVLYKNSAK